MNESIYSADFTASFPLVLQDDETIVALAKIVAEPLEVFANETKLATIYANIDNLPEAVLDVLAYDFKVDWYNYDYSIEQKRETIKNSWNVHRTLGTKYAVETAISAVYPNTKVEEWFEYGGKPYFFRLNIDVTDTLPNPEGHQQVLKRLRYYKNLRSHIDEISYVIRPGEDQNVRMGGCMSSIVRLPVMEIVDDICMDSEVFAGGAVAAHTRIPLPEMRDSLQFNSSIKTGGEMANQTRISVPEI